jgi:hypothetical protein
MFWDWLSGRKEYTRKNKNQNSEDFDSGKQLRGRKLLTRQQANKEAQKYIKGKKIFWAGINLPIEAVSQNFVFVGQIKSGKTVSMKHLMFQVLGDIGLVENDKRGLVYDAKGDFVSFLYGVLERFGHKKPDDVIKILNPFDARCVGWAMSKDITEPVHVQTVSTIFIPNQEGNNRYFSDAGRELLDGVMNSFNLTSKREFDNKLEWSLLDVCLAFNDEESLRKILLKHRETSDPVDFLNRSNNEVFTTVKSYIKPFLTIASAWQGRKTISLREWRDNKKGTILVLGRDPEAKSAIERLNRVFFERLSQILLKDEDTTNRQSWLFLDEFSKMGKLTGFDDLITNGRSKGTCIALAFQNIQGVKKVYGEELADEIISECGSKAFLKCDGETARWASKEIGKTLKEKKSRTVSSSNNLSIQVGETIDSKEEDVIYPSDFADLPIAGTENGVGGFYITSWVSGVWKHQQDWNQNKLGEIAQITSTEPNIVERNKDESEPYYQYPNMEHWKDRLKILGKVEDSPSIEDNETFLAELNKVREERRNEKKL